MSYYDSNHKVRCNDTGEVVTLSAYLNSKHWRMMRQRVYDFYKGECQRCHSVIPIEQCQVHHRTYKRFGNERINDLVLYCHKCHNVIHKNKNLDHHQNITLQLLIKNLTVEEKEKVYRYIAKLCGYDTEELLCRVQEKAVRDAAIRRNHQKKVQQTEFVTGGKFRKHNSGDSFK